MAENFFSAGPSRIFEDFLFPPQKCSSLSRAGSLSRGVFENFEEFLAVGGGGVVANGTSPVIVSKPVSSAIVMKPVSSAFVDATSSGEFQAASSREFLAVGDRSVGSDAGVRRVKLGLATMEPVPSAFVDIIRKTRHANAAFVDTIPRQISGPSAELFGESHPDLLRQSFSGLGFKSAISAMAKTGETNFTSFIYYQPKD